MRRLRRAVKALLQNMDEQHAQILKQLRRGQGDKKNTSKQVVQPVPCKQRPLIVTRSCPLHKTVMQDGIRGHESLYANRRLA